MALTKTYTIEIEGQKGIATVGQLKAEIEKLEGEMDGLTLGTAEADAAIQKLGKAKGALKELEDAVDALNPKEKAAAFVDFANGVVGAFGVASVAAEQFGLSSETVEEYQNKLLSLMTVMQGVEAVHKALNSETQSVLKSVLGLGNGWSLAGVKAKLFGTTTRAALISTGIGVLIVAVGLLVANWDKVVAVAGKIKDAFKPQLDAVSGFVDNLIDKARDLASVLSFGLIDDAATAAIARQDAADKKATEARIAWRKNLIAEEAAAGRATYQLKQKQLADELSLLEKGTQQYADKLSEIRQLKLSHDKSLADRDENAWKEALEKEKKASEESLKLAQEKYAKRRELEGQALAAELAASDEARKKRYEQAKADGATPSQLLRVEIENLASVQADLISQGKRFGSEYLAVQNEIAEKEKAIVTANLEDIKKAKAEKQRLQEEELTRMQEASDIAIINLRLQGATEREVTEATIKGLEEQLAYMQKAGLARTKAFAELKLQVKELKDGLVPESSDLMSRLLKGIFNIDPGKIDEVKASIEQSMATIYSSIGYISDTLVSDSLLKLDSYMAYLDEQLSLAQERTDAADQSLQESMKRRESLESQLDNSRGAKREYLIQQIEKERQEEAKLTAEKKKAATEEAKVIKQKEAAEQKRQELEAKGQTLAAASVAITNAVTAVDAVSAAVKAVKAGAGLTPPANIIAIGAGVAAVAAAVASAKQLANTVKAAKFEQGGEVKGPSHAQGGVPFTVKGQPGYEMEGDEFIVRKSAYKNNMDTIKKINAIGNSVRFVAIPEHQVKRRAEGGEAATGAGAAGTVAVAGDSMPSMEELGAIRAVLERIEQHAARTAEKEPGFIGPWESRKIVDQARSLDKDEAAGKLY